MKAEELMIGDFVKFTDNDRVVYACKVAGITDRNEVFLAGDEGLELDLFDDDLDSVEPIEITKGFLLKNDFLEVDNRYEPNTYLKHSDVDERGFPCSTIRVALYNDCTLVKIENCKSRHPIALHHPFAPCVHQLQHACRLCGIDINWKL